MTFASYTNAMEKVKKILYAKSLSYLSFGNPGPPLFLPPAAGTCDRALIMWYTARSNTLRRIQ